VRSCAIHDDAYDTKYVCEECKADPANAGWIEGAEVARPPTNHDQPVRWGEGSKCWQPSRLFRRIAGLLAEGLSRREVARRVGCSVTYVQKVGAELGL
jgi:hypothetical protein